MRAPLSRRDQPPRQLTEGLALPDLTAKRATTVYRPGFLAPTNSPSSPSHGSPRTEIPLPAQPQSSHQSTLHHQGAPFPPPHPRTSPARAGHLPMSPTVSDPRATQPVLSSLFLENLRTSKSACLGDRTGHHSVRSELTVSLPGHRDQMQLHVQAPAATLLSGTWTEGESLQRGAERTGLHPPPHTAGAGAAQHRLLLCIWGAAQDSGWPFPSQDLGPTCKAMESGQLSHRASCLTSHTGVPGGTWGRGTARKGEVPLPVGPKPGLSSHTAPRESQLKGD